MDTDDIDMGYESSASSTSDIEEELEYLEHHTNEHQLKLLQKEINHIVIHGIEPDEKWYTERYKYIKSYAELNWSDMAQRFENKDTYMYATSVYIINLLYELHNEYTTKPTFNLNRYYQLIHEIRSIWEYYSKRYVGGEGDTDVVDLIEGLSFMNTK